MIESGGISLKSLLVGYELPDVFVRRIMRCISTATFLIRFNGIIYGFFGSRSGKETLCLF